MPSTLRQSMSSGRHDWLHQCIKTTHVLRLVVGSGGLEAASYSIRSTGGSGRNELTRNGGGRERSGSPIATARRRKLAMVRVLRVGRISERSDSSDQYLA